MPMSKIFKEIASDISGATAVEYGLILSLIFFAMLVALQNFGNVTIKMWNDVSKTMQDAS